jgi:hypothetical protein
MRAGAIHTGDERDDKGSENQLIFGLCEIEGRERWRDGEAERKGGGSTKEAECERGDAYVSGRKSDIGEGGGGGAFLSKIIRDQRPRAE